MTDPIPPIIPLMSDEQMRQMLKELLPESSDALDVAAACGEMNRTIRDLYEAHVASLLEKIRVMEEAGEALVKRWDTPRWKDVPHTATFIHALRDALSLSTGGQEPPSVGG